MFTHSSYRLEERSDDGWVSADPTLERIRGGPGVERASTLKEVALSPGEERRYRFEHLDELPPGEYRVTMGTRDGKRNNTRHTLSFSR